MGPPSADRYRATADIAQAALKLQQARARMIPEQLCIAHVKALRLLALERDTTLQAVAIEAFNDVLKKHGRRPVVRNPLLE